MNRKDEQILYEELVVGVGFVNGLLIREGISPKKELLSAIGFQDLAVIITILNGLIFLTALKKARYLVNWFGPLAVLLGFASGFWILNYNRFGAILILGAMSIGLMASAFAKLPSRF